MLENRTGHMHEQNIELFPRNVFPKARQLSDD